MRHVEGGYKDLDDSVLGRCPYKGGCCEEFWDLEVGVGVG